MGLTRTITPASLANSRSSEQVFPFADSIERTADTNIRTNRTESPMTATMSPSDLHRSDPHANYALRRCVAAGLLVMVLALVAIAASAAVGALLDVDGRPAAASDVAAAPIVRIHVAQPGDTLWSIAEQYRGDVGQGRFVDALIAVNGGTSIQAGQAIRLP
jgi:hypothetical protein